MKMKIAESLHVETVVLFQRLIVVIFQMQRLNYFGYWSALAVCCVNCSTLKAFFSLIWVKFQLDCANGFPSQILQTFSNRKSLQIKINQNLRI